MTRTITDWRNTDLGGVLQAAARGVAVNDSEVNALTPPDGVPPATFHAAIRKSVTLIRQLHDDGAFGLARTAAAELGDEYLAGFAGGLPEAQNGPTAADLEAMSPKELGELIAAPRAL